MSGENDEETEKFDPKIRQVFESNLSRYEDYRRASESLISSAINSKGLKVLSVTSRVKDFDSFNDKIRRKGYEIPFAETTDIVGVRVITYLESDVNEVRNIVADLLEIDEQNSVDKRVPDEVGSAGYRSLHLVCKLGDERRSLPENASFEGLCLEVQVRTALQHTWAEIEHKQRYKASTELPKHLARRLMMVSATLELLDRELAQISSEAKEYREDLISGKIDIQENLLGTSSLNILLQDFARKRRFKTQPVEEFSPVGDQILSELSAFGIADNESLKKMISEIGKQYKKWPPWTTVVGLARDMMILSNADLFFDHVYSKSFDFSLDDIATFRDFYEFDLGDQLRRRGIEAFSTE